MSRGLHVNTEAVLSNVDLQVFHLVTFDFSAPFRLTDWVHDIDYNFGSGTETFQSTGRLVSTSGVKESLNIANDTLSLTFTGANSADISLALTENFNDKQVIIRRGFFDSTGETTDANIITDPFIIFDGRVSSYKIDDDPMSGESAVTWEIASHWAKWDQVAGRKCNNENAQIYFATETGFSETFNQIGDRTWGKVRS